MRKEELLGIIEKVVAGDEVAYEALYRFYYPQVYRFALYISHCDADAHDIAQETMIAVHDKLYTLQKPEFFHAWIKRITINQSTKLFRKGKHVVFSDLVVKNLEYQEDLHMESNPTKSMHFQNDQSVMTYFFGMLPKGQREVMELLYFEQHTMKEIADTLKVPEGTVKSRIHTAKAELKTKIQRYQEDENIVLDFRSDALLSFLGGGTLLSTLLQPVMKAKSFLGASVAKTSLIAITSISLGVGGVVLAKNILEDARENETVSENVAQAKTFQFAIVDNQEIKTAQDGFFKIVTWANNEEDMRAASIQEIQEIEQLLISLREFGGSYYTLLESNGWLEKFEKSKK